MQPRQVEYSYLDKYSYSCELLRLLRHLTHWGRVTHICVSKLAIIGSDNGLSPGRRPAIIWTNTGILLIRTLGRNFSEILGKIHSFSSKKMHFKMSSAKGRLFSLGINELTEYQHVDGVHELSSRGVRCRSRLVNRQSKHLPSVGWEQKKAISC